MLYARGTGFNESAYMIYVTAVSASCLHLGFIHGLSWRSSGIRRLR